MILYLRPDSSYDRDQRHLEQKGFDMASIPMKARKLFKSDSEAHVSAEKVKSPRLGLHRFFERSKLRRGFASNFDIHKELEELETVQQSDDAILSSDNNNSIVFDSDVNIDEGIKVVKPQLRRRHSFSTIESMAKMLIEKVGIEEWFECLLYIRANNTHHTISVPLDQNFCLFCILCFVFDSKVVVSFCVPD